MRRLRGWGHCAERWGWDRHRNKERESWGHVPSECPGHFPSDSLSYPKLHHPSPKPQDFFFHLRQLVLEFLSLATQSLDEQKYSVSFLLYITLFVFLKILFDVDHQRLFKVFIEFVTIWLLFSVLGFCPWGTWDPSSSTRDWIHARCTRRWSLNRWTTVGAPQMKILNYVKQPSSDTPFTWFS